MMPVGTHNPELRTRVAVEKLSVLGSNTRPRHLMDPLDTVEPTSESVELAGLLRDCLEEAVVAVDPQGRICSFNPQAERLTGLSRDAVMGQPFQVLPEALRQLITSASEQKDDRTAPVLLPLQDDPGFVARASAHYCQSQDDQLLAVLVVMHDMAAARKLGLNMQRLDRLASIGTLSASMAHEIKNALVAISTFVDDLLLRNKDSELAGLVSREFRRVDAIVSQMLKFAGPAKPTFCRISLHRILDQSLHLIQPQLESKRIRLQCQFAAHPDVVEGDVYHLEQAFLNVLLNAVAAMDSDGQLSVSTQNVIDASEDVPAPQSAVEILIADTGIGIPPENLSRLFEPFFSTKAQGTGLGLSITRRILLEHRGTVSVESQVGQGTTFRFTLPVAE